jgi:hypothetical protein
LRADSPDYRDRPCGTDAQELLYFYDFIHFTNQGAEKVSEILAEELKRKSFPNSRSFSSHFYLVL